MGDSSGERKCQPEKEERGWSARSWEASLLPEMMAGGRSLRISKQAFQVVGDQTMGGGGEELTLLGRCRALTRDKAMMPSDFGG